jgi:hypothetical protein
MRTRRLLPLLALLALLAPAASASAAELRTNYACYIAQAEEITFTASGFTPGATISFRTLGQEFARQVADANGAAAVRQKAPAHRSGTKSISDMELGAQAVELGNEGNQAAVDFTVVNFAGIVNPRRVRNGRRFAFEVVGFLPNQQLYVHFVRRGRSRAVVRTRRARGDCGRALFSVRRWPRSLRTRKGAWKVVVTGDRRYRGSRSRGLVFNMRLL